MRWQLNKRRIGDVNIIDMKELSDPEGQNAQDLRETVKELIGEGERKLLVNLAGVRYMDSSGIADLVLCFIAAKDNGAELKLLKPQKKVHDMLVITRLLDVFEISHDEKKAIASFQT